ncbi:MAG TPA: hypothetical protein PLL04_07080 [Thauera sp.]|nr:hypothetical protein [Thauera sp.]
MSDIGSLPFMLAFRGITRDARPSGATRMLQQLLNLVNKYGRRSV